MKRGILVGLVRVSLAAILVLFALAASASCVQIIGIEEVPEGDPHNSHYAETRFREPTCAACVDDACGNEARACHDDHLCRPHLECRAGCGIEDVECRNRCAKPLGANPRVDAIDACLRQNCLGNCVDCGVYGDIGGAACAACVGKPPCCEIATAVSEHPGADIAAVCAFAAPNSEASTACNSNLALSDYDVLVKMNSCIVSCSACKLGTDWSCVGKYDHARNAVSTVNYTVELLDPNGNRVEGLHVRACDGGDAGCTRPNGDMVVSDANGVATLNLGAAVLDGFNGYLEITDPKERIVNHLQAVDHLIEDRIDRLQLLDRAFIDTASKMLGGTRTLKNSAVGILVSGDCKNAFAPDIAFDVAAPFDKGSAHEAALVVYYHSGSHYALDATDSVGTGFAIVTPDDGKLTQAHLDFDMRLYDSQKLVGGGAMPLRIGWVSRAFGRPTPSQP